MEWFRKNNKQDSSEVNGEKKVESIPYDIFGPGIMVADANVIRRVASKQFKAANRIRLYKKQA